MDALVYGCLCVLVSTSYAGSGGEVHILLQVDSSVPNDTLLAADKAVDLINTHCHFILSEHKLKLLQVPPQPCSATSCVLSGALISYLVAPANNFTAPSLIGAIVASQNFRADLKILTPLFSRFFIPLVSVSPSLELLPGVIQMLPMSSVLLDAVVQLSKGVKWTRVGVISDSFHPSFVASAQHLLRMLSAQNVAVSPYIELGRQDELYAVEIIKQYAVKVIVISAGIDKVVRVLCATRDEGLVWPDYVWIVHSLTAAEVESQLNCGHVDSLEGVVFVSSSIIRASSASSTEHCNRTIQSFTSAHARLVFDSILLLSLAARWTTASNVGVQAVLSDVRYTGLSGKIVFDSDGQLGWQLPLLQLRNGSDVVLGIYANNTLVLMKDFVEDFPPSDLEYVYPPYIPLWLSLLEVTLLTVFITVVLALYIFFRKEPEIRATSTSLSLIMFLGCYLLALYLAMLALSPFIGPIAGNFNICSLLVWLSGVGISLPLIYATLLVKMLRVYHIFNYHGKLGKLSSDFAMLLFILLVLAPNFVILMIFTVLSQYRWLEESSVELGHVEVFSDCSGNYIVFYIFLCAYLLVLMTCISCVAIKTRKVRMKQFRDARKVNILLFLMIVMGVTSLILFKILDDERYRLQADIVLHLAHNSMIILCLVILFLPKILPILHKRVFKAS